MLRKDRWVDGEQCLNGIGAARRPSCWWCMCTVRRIQMARKLSASYRLGKQIQTSAESIWNKPLNERQKTALDAAAGRQKRVDASAIDYSDSPALTGKQLTQFRRSPKELVAVRLDADVFEWLQQYGPGYSTQINNVLRAVMS